MISGVRDHVLALACLRHGAPSAQGRGMDNLPKDATAAITGALVRSLDIGELAHAACCYRLCLLPIQRCRRPALANLLAHDHRTEPAVRTAAKP